MSGGIGSDWSTEDLPARRAWFLGWGLAALGGLTAGAAVVSSPGDVGAAAGQDWSPFVLVAGLLLVGLVANDDGLFATAGHRIATWLPTGPMLFIGVVVMIGGVTAVLNLDTSVAFLTPVLVYTARSRGGGEAPLLFASILLANAGSLFLPGSNLTNLIVLGRRHLTGGAFLGHMWFAGAASLIVTAAVVAIAERTSLRTNADDVAAPVSPVLGVGLAAILAATAGVVLLPAPAVPVAAVGLAAVVVRLSQRRQTRHDVLAILGVPVLAGLFGLAVALGTLGRVWSAPSTLLSHLNAWGTATVAAVGSVLLNNLPAASLLAARTPPRPYALLVGLNLGPNLFITGSLSWFLWLRAARTAGALPSIARATRIGLIAVPLSLAAAVAALGVTGSR